MEGRLFDESGDRERIEYRCHKMVDDAGPAIQDRHDELVIVDVNVATRGDLWTHSKGCAAVACTGKGITVVASCTARS